MRGPTEKRAEFPVVTSNRTRVPAGWAATSPAQGSEVGPTSSSTVTSGPGVNDGGSCPGDTTGGDGGGALWPGAFGGTGGWSGGWSGPGTTAGKSPKFGPARGAGGCFGVGWV